MTKKQNERDFDPATDLRLHRGGHLGVRLIELDDERSAWIPEGFIVQVAPDTTHKPAPTPGGAHGPSCIGDPYPSPPSRHTAFLARLRGVSGETQPFPT